LTLKIHYVCFKENFLHFNLKKLLFGNSKNHKKTKNKKQNKKKSDEKFNQIQLSILLMWFEIYAENLNKEYLILKSSKVLTSWKYRTQDKKSTPWFGHKYGNLKI
jgi:hypothetical protein